MELEKKKDNLDREIQKLKDEKAHFKKEQEDLKAKQEEEKKKNEEYQKLWYKTNQKKFDAERKAIFANNLLESQLQLPLALGLSA